MIIIIYNKKENIMKIILLCFIYIFLSNNILANECQYSKWGRDDQKGNANLITDESVLNASSLIKKGKVYSLGITIDSNTPHILLDLYHYKLFNQINNSAQNLLQILLTMMMFFKAGSALVLK